MKSKQIIFTGKRQAELVEAELDGPGEGQVVVQTSVSLVSVGTEGYCYRGEFDDDTGWSAWVKYPFAPGYSSVGRIVEVGAGVDGWRAGERVFSGGGHQQYHVCASSQPVRLPDAIGDEEAAWSSLCFITQTAVRRGEHTMGDTAAVIGLGPIGQLVTQYLRVVGARQVLAIDTVAGRLDAAAAHGATAVFKGTAEDAKGFIEKHTDGEGADVVYDASGNWRVLPHAIGLARQFGVVMLVGDTPFPTRQHLTHDVLSRQVDIRGTHNTKLQPQFAHWTRQRQIKLFYTYLQRGQMRVDDLITHQFRPADAAEAFMKMDADRSDMLGTMFDWR